jgi:hypothetical protein
MPLSRPTTAFAIALSLLLHALLVGGVFRWGAHVAAPAVVPAEQVVVIDLSAPQLAAEPPPVSAAPLRGSEAVPAVAAPPPQAYRDAPPAPTAEEWALASTYTLKNSKRYRHTWGQQVRSQMGTAFEGPDQGVVRFRVEIAPNGRLQGLETLWKTSDEAERLARQAVLHMPPLPPTPTGQPLVFETTISFQPFETDVPPLYKNDCLPDPPRHRNRFAWDGQSPQTAAPPPAAAVPLDPQALAECLKQLPEDSIEAESGHDRRQLEQWGSSRLGR